MKFTVKNWDIFYNEDKNSNEFKVKRYDQPFYISGNVGNNEISTEQALPKYLVQAILRFYPFRAWHFRQNELEIMLTAPETRKTYNIYYDPGEQYLYIDYPNEIPRTLREYLQTYMYFQNKNEDENQV